MDSSYDKDKSSKRSRDDRRVRGRDGDREAEHKHRHRERDEKHREHRHRSSDHKSSKHDERESRREDRESSCDRDSRIEDLAESRARDIKREKSYEDRESRREREISHEREGARRREVKREGLDGDDVTKEGRKKRRDREDSEERREKKVRVSDDKREKRRRFEYNFVKEENNGSISANVNFSDISVKKEVNDGGSSNGNGATVESFTKASRNFPDDSTATGHSLCTKVSSISTTNENKGVNITRSHEVTGKSSTDGTSSAAGKSGSLSLDALAKAKKALQMQKELSEKLKKIPLLSKASSSDGSQISGSSCGTENEQGLVPSTTTSLSAGAASSLSTLTDAATPGLTSIHNIEAVKRAQKLAAKMGFRQDPEFAPLINLFPGQMPVDVAAPQKPTKAPVLRVNALGREIDEHGNVVNVTKPSNLSTLKVNINKQKKDAFQILKPELDVDAESNPHFDSRMGINKNKLLRPKRMTFQFVEEGKWSKEAEILKVKSQFGEAGAKERQAKQAQLAKAKGGSEINPNLIEVAERVIPKEKPKETILEIEWWDAPLLLAGSYADICDGGVIEEKLKMEKITIYVEHPHPIEPPAEPAPPPPQPLKLTKKEQKKLRTQRRLAREKDRQDMIRQGLIEPPKPKVKMSNLMKVLGSEATQDPTRLEKEVRSAAAEREQAHIDRNIARKLTPAERRGKKERKLFDDSNTSETIVSVYKINDLSHPQTRFKVDVNAHENRLTGCSVISEGISVVVVEGGSKSIKRYEKLMLKRIDWAKVVIEEGEDVDVRTNKPVNKCVLVWQGNVAKPSFNRFSVHECLTGAAAKKVFADAGVAHYWDLAVNFNDDHM